MTRTQLMLEPRGLRSLCNRQCLYFPSNRFSSPMIIESFVLAHGHWNDPTHPQTSSAYLLESSNIDQHRHMGFFFHRLAICTSLELPAMILEIQTTSGKAKDSDILSSPRCRRSLHATEPKPYLDGDSNPQNSSAPSSGCVRSLFDDDDDQCARSQRG